MNTTNYSGVKLNSLKLLIPQADKKNEKINGPAILRMKYLDWQPVLLFLFLLSIWFATWVWLQHTDPAGAVIGQNIWLLLVLGLIAFLLILALCAWLMHLFLLKMGLPNLSLMVSQFKTLELWQQLGFYFASFGLLLAAALACLTAIC